MSVTIWHNPRCSKSRQTLQLLQDRGTEFSVFEYLKSPPTIEQINEVLTKLDLEPKDIIRKTEATYREQELATVESNEELVEAMRNYPILIERPIVINGDKAAIGRPPEAVLAIL